MTEPDHRAWLKSLSQKIRITKITATRSIRGNTGGQTFAGFTARSDSLEEDTGGLLTEGDMSGSGQGISEARLTYYILAMQADLAAINSSWAGGGMSIQHRDEMLRTTRRNYASLLGDAVTGDPHE